MDGGITFAGPWPDPQPPLRVLLDEDDTGRMVAYVVLHDATIDQIAAAVAKRIGKPSLPESVRSLITSRIVAINKLVGARFTDAENDALISEREELEALLNG